MNFYNLLKRYINRDLLVFIMKKKLVVLIAVIIIIVIAFFMLSSSVSAAQLYLEDGSAEVIRDGESVEVSEGMDLKLNDVIKVLSGEVTVIFFKTDVVRLDKGSEIILSNLDEEDIVFEQNTGLSWSRVTNLAGVKKYTVDTPNGVATVRGTGFGVGVDGFETSVFVDDGEVEFSIDGEKQIINANEKYVSKSGQIVKESLTEKELGFIEKNVLSDLIILKKIRRERIDDQKTLKFAIKKSQGWTEEDVDKFMEEVDRGEHDVDEVIEKSPIKLSNIQKIADLTRQIQKLNIRTNEETRTLQKDIESEKYSSDSSE